MILGRLFDALFERKVVWRITSNRARTSSTRTASTASCSLPFIDRIKARCEVIELTGRARLAAGPDQGRAGLVRDDAEAQAVRALWADLKGDMPEMPGAL